MSSLQIVVSSPRNIYCINVFIAITRLQGVNTMTTDVLHTDGNYIHYPYYHSFIIYIHSPKGLNKVCCSSKSSVYCAERIENRMSNFIWSHFLFICTLYKYMLYSLSRFPLNWKMFFFSTQYIATGKFRYQYVIS